MDNTNAINATVDIGAVLAQWHDLDMRHRAINFARGDLVLLAVPETLPGRPADPDLPTLGDFAFQVGLSVSQVSEYRACSLFYPENVRGDKGLSDLKWSFWNAARKFADGKLDNALELLHDAARFHYNSVDDFRQHLKEKFGEPVGEKAQTDFIRMSLSQLAHGGYKMLANSLHKRGHGWDAIVEITVKVVK